MSMCASAALALLLPALAGATEPSETAPASEPVEIGIGPATMSGDPAGGAPITPPMGVLPPEIAARAAEVRNRPLAERMGAVSELLLDRPYVSDPMGEGQGIDADPYTRYDVFDCLTFAEEVIALALSGDPYHSAAVRHGLRYGDAERTYATRRHFMELQWIPGVVADGWVTETTAEYGPTETYEREVTSSLWDNWGRRSLFHLTDAQLPVGTMRLEYLPLEAALEAVDDIRPGSLIMALRVDRSWVPIWITHVGFTVPGDRPTLRHATNMPSSRITRDNSLEWYVEHIGTYKHWKSAGIAVFEPVEFGPRQSLLPEDLRAEVTTDPAH